MNKTNESTSFNTSGTKLRDLDVQLFIRKNCKWCNDMINDLSKAAELDHVEVVDVETKEGLEKYRIPITSSHMQNEWSAAAASLGCGDYIAVPLFYSKKNETVLIGYRKNIEDIIKSLSLPRE